MPRLALLGALAFSFAFLGGCGSLQTMTRAVARPRGLPRLSRRGGGGDAARARAALPRPASERRVRRGGEGRLRRRRAALVRGGARLARRAAPLHRRPAEWSCTPMLHARSSSRWAPRWKTRSSSTSSARSGSTTRSSKPRRSAARRRRGDPRRARRADRREQLRERPPEAPPALRTLMLGPNAPTWGAVPARREDHHFFLLPTRRSGVAPRHARDQAAARRRRGRRGAAGRKRPDRALGGGGGDRSSRCRVAGGPHGSSSFRDEPARRGPRTAFSRSHVRRLATRRRALSPRL